MSNYSKGGRFQPYISPQMQVRELGVVPVVLGALLGMIFGASSLYLVLKVGLTVSASIPVAVISITIFKLLSKVGLRDATILENNIVQTGGSAGESIAFGVGVTMPAIMLLGFELELGRIMVVATLGACLGILMMIPLRRALIVEQHGTLKYPEGTACAEVLKAGDAGYSRQLAAAQRQGRSDRAQSSPHRGRAGSLSGQLIFAGFGIGLVYKAAMAAFRLWKEIPTRIFSGVYKGGSISAEISPELMGVGYIIGPRVASIMCAGGVLSYLVLIPLIKFFGDAIAEPLLPATMLIKDMSPDQVRGNYIMYIGAGAVAAGGIISVCKSMPIIWSSIRAGLGMVSSAVSGGAQRCRTDQDLPLKFVLIGIVVLVAAITAAPALKMNLLGALLLVIFGFLFSTVSSRVTGEIGSSSNPISGMTVATLILTCLVFLIIGWTSPAYYVTALSVGAVVAIAASNAGTTSQDLKTGYLVGATPKSQQIAILIGALCSALVLGPVLMRLNTAGTIYVPHLSYEKVTVSAPPLAKSDHLPLFSGEWLPDDNAYALLTVPASGEFNGQTNLLSPGSYLINEAGAPQWKLMTNYPASLKANPEEFKEKTTLAGIQGRQDTREYHVWFNQDAKAGLIGKYLAREDGSIAYMVDPGVNGTYSTRPDGSVVPKFGAPQATLMATIIKGILSRELPWGLVLTGVVIAVLLEMCKVPSLAFAVGLYLPLSSSAPIFVGGMIRLLVDWHLKRKHKNRRLTPEQLAAEGDKSPGVLLASGYIAGGAIAGIIIAFVVGVFPLVADNILNWAQAHNPFFAGAWSNPLSLIPFTLIGVLLYLTGRDYFNRFGPPPRTGGRGPGGGRGGDSRRYSGRRPYRRPDQANRNRQSGRGGSGGGGGSPQQYGSGQQSGGTGSRGSNYRQHGTSHGGGRQGGYRSNQQRTTYDGDGPDTFSPGVRS
ncbi:MAG: OPT family oligopeptide transporter [Limisphaerales bacterium]|jgi:putative OPT family oligopeptide transporter